MNKNLFLRIIKIIGFSLLSVIIVLFLIIGGLNIFKHFYYGEYFSIMTKVGKIAGLSHGFVPQGITYFDEGDNSFFVSVGYMSDGSASRIYAVDEESGDSLFFNITSGGQDFYGHTGGIQYEDGYFYLANDGTGIYKFSSDFMFSGQSGSNVEIGNVLPLINHSSFVFSQPGYLYVGEFNNDAKYSCTNSITYKGINHMAIVGKYDINKLDFSGTNIPPKPVAVYSIPNEIQGFCITEEGSIVLSRSYSVSSSNFFIYNPEDIIATGDFYEGAPVYFLGEPSANILGPAMSEDLDLYNDMVITHFESACHKYFFGKLFFANYIAGLKL